MCFLRKGFLFPADLPAKKNEYETNIMHGVLFAICSIFNMALCSFFADYYIVKIFFPCWQSFISRKNIALALQSVQSKNLYYKINKQTNKKHTQQQNIIMSLCFIIKISTFPFFFFSLSRSKSFFCRRTSVRPRLAAYPYGSNFVSKGNKLDIKLPVQFAKLNDKLGLAAVSYVLG